MDKYSPTKIHICGARANGKSSISMILCEAVARADVYQWFDWRDSTVHFYSKNQSAPLTDEEKRLLRNHLGIHMYPFKVVFDDCKYPLEDLMDGLKENPHIHKSEDLVDEEGNSI